MSVVDAGPARRSRWAWVAFPAGVLLCMLILVGLNLNGSSIALLSSERPAPGLLAGTPRTIRSDEWRLRTPIALSSVRQGLPDRPWLGLNPTDQAATAHGGPTRDWTTLLKPQDWGYVLLGESRGLAVSWWWPYAIGLIGCFALFGQLTGRPLDAALLSTAAVFTPYAGWWTAPNPALFLGYAALAAACLLAAWKARMRRHAAALAIAAGLSGVALALSLYPPWQVSLGWVVLAACIGFALDARIGWRRILWALCLTLGTALLLVGVWVAQHRAAILAQAATYYPGHRLSTPGTGSLNTVLAAPLNFWMSGGAGATLGRTGESARLNLSEAASTWLPLPVAALLLVGVLELLARTLLGPSLARVTVPGRASDHQVGSVEPAEGATKPDAPIWTLALVAGAMLLLLGWTFMELPTVLGKVTLLDRVPSQRTPLALGFALLVLVALTSRVSHRRPLAWTWPALGLGALATAVATLWSDEHLPWDSGLTPTALVLLSGLVVGGTFAGLAYCRVRLVAGLVLAAYAVTSWLFINPLQYGIAPVAEDPLVRRLARVTDGAENMRVGVFASPGRRSLITVAKVRAAGLQSLTGTTFYPDPSLMRSLFPEQKSLWNNYATYVWILAPPNTPRSITQIRGTSMTLTVPVCDPVMLAQADPGWIVSDRKLDVPCLSRASVLKRPGYPRMWIYRVAS